MLLGLGIDLAEINGHLRLHVPGNRHLEALRPWRHYTSVPNILKPSNPLFLDDAKFDTAWDSTKKRGSQ